jgi:BirA family transcriptional regulator, biotin operon repressor / biotin---[acetyl-CoA-carboxylase] ligase
MDEASLAARLHTRWLGRAFEWHAACGSTNDLAAERARAGAPAGLVIVADAQTAGRGRLGRTWHSPAEENLYLSILLRPARPSSEIPPITLLAGAAVARALETFGLRPQLKWPNDVELVELVDETGPEGKNEKRRRKVAGILTEMASAGGSALHVVVGVGINANAVAFPPEIAERATSLRRALGRAVDRVELLAALLEAFEPLCEAFDRRGPAAAVEAFEAHAAFPAPCRVTAPGRPQERLEGIALGVEPDGALRLRDQTGQIHRVISGELS